MEHLGMIQETAYLSTGNTPRYRRIMRVFYQEYEKMHFQMDKEEVLELVRQYPEFEDYSMEQLKADLNMLSEWKNLTPIQDPKRVYTIEDYKNKQYRYSMSEYAVEIERLTVKLENLFMEGGSLSGSYFVRIEEELVKADLMLSASPKEVNEWWHNLQEDFRRLNQNYQDYLREFYSGKSEKMLKSVEFILHKDHFIKYLKEFVKELQTKAPRVERIMKQIDEQRERELLEQVIASELEIPHPSFESGESMERYIRENVYGKWSALKRWFMAEPGRVSECSRVLDITDEVIRKIIQNASLIVQLQNWGISRKDDYKKFISMFQNCCDIEEAHKLSAHVFGIQHVRHFKINGDRSTDDISSSTYEEEPMEFFLKPRTRAYRPRVDKTGFENKSMEKLAQRNMYLKKAEEDRKMVLRYIEGSRLELSKIHETVSIAARETLLRWIAAANLTDSAKGRTEYGQAYRLIKTKETCTLKCEDGDLVMPSYILEFAEEENGSGSDADGAVLGS